MSCEWAEGQFSFLKHHFVHYKGSSPTHMYNYACDFTAVLLTGVYNCRDGHLGSNSSNVISVCLDFPLFRSFPFNLIFDLSWILHNITIDHGEGKSLKVLIP